MEFSAQQIADFLHGEVVGNPDVKVHTISKIEDGKAGTLSFLSNPKYIHFAYSTQASILLVNRDFQPEHTISSTLIKVDDAYQSLAALLQLVDSYKKNKSGIDTLAFVSGSAAIGESPYIGAFAFIGDNVHIGDNVKIYPQCYIGDGVVIDDDAIVYAGVKIYADCRIGKRCIIHSGAVLGADGFGFAPDGDGAYNKIPRIGNVILEDDVEIGANTTVDSATLGSTIIHKGTKLDNLIMVAHSVEIGSNSVIAAQSGIAGSTKIGDNCMFGGQVGIAGHLHIGNNVKLGAQSGVMGNIADDLNFMGSPAFDLRRYIKSYAYFRKLPDLVQTIDTLQKEIAALKEKLIKNNVQKQ